MNFIIYDKTGTILRTIDCPPAMTSIQAKEGEFIMAGVANDVTQKIVDGEIVDKTPEEIEAVNPNLPLKDIPKKKRVAYITNGVWEDTLKRIDRLEKQQ